MFFLSQMSVGPLRTVKAPKTKLPKASTECVICEFVMNKVDSLLGQNKSVVRLRLLLKLGHKVEAFMERSCARMILLRML